MKKFMIGFVFCFFSFSLAEANENDIRDNSLQLNVAFQQQFPRKQPLKRNSNKEEGFLRKVIGKFVVSVEGDKPALLDYITVEREGSSSNYDYHALYLIYGDDYERSKNFYFDSKMGEDIAKSIFFKPLAIYPNRPVEMYLYALESLGEGIKEDELFTVREISTNAGNIVLNNEQFEKEKISEETSFHREREFRKEKQVGRDKRRDRIRKLFRSKKPVISPNPNAWYMRMP